MDFVGHAFEDFAQTQFVVVNALEIRTQPRVLVLARPALAQPRGFFGNVEPQKRDVLGVLRIEKKKVSVLYIAMYGQQSPASVKQCAWIWETRGTYLPRHGVDFVKRRAARVWKRLAFCVKEKC